MGALAFWTGERGEGTQEWLDHYWESRTAAHRDIVVQLVGRMLAQAPEGSSTHRSVLEVGCHCGPNIVRLLTQLPGTFCHGVDCNPEAIAHGQARLRQAGLAGRTRLVCGVFPDATRLFQSGAVDVSLTCYTLAYLSPAQLVPALRELVRLARRGVVMVEPQGTGQHTVRTQYEEWRHDYGKALHMALQGSGRRWWHYAIDPSAGALDAAFIVGPQQARE